MTERKTFTVEVYKTDKRTSSGIRMVKKTDHSEASKSDLHHIYKTTWPASHGYSFKIIETYSTRKNLMTGKEYLERYDVPLSCSPASETYWSM